MAIVAALVGAQLWALGLAAVGVVLWTGLWVRWRATDRPYYAE